MRNTWLNYRWMMALILTTPLLSGPALAESPQGAGQTQDMTTLQLHISEDGSAIVDQSGKEVARFSEGMRVNPEQPGRYASRDACAAPWSASSGRASAV
ncbi:MAG: hypothetical protein Q8L89_04725 [Gammaproteobacteria bacterium]|nr:hypothetical protein [Gammaproteobacteria bacterium]